MPHKKIVVIGLGTLGSRVASILSKKNYDLLLIDRDIVEKRNLKAQPLYKKADIGRPKASAAAERLGKISRAKIDAAAADLNYKTIGTLLADTNLILDCTDNLETRFLINDFCKKGKKPWIYSAAVRNIGTVLAFAPGGPCLRCILGDSPRGESCELAGIETGTAAKVASLQAAEAMKILAGKPPEKRMMRISPGQRGIHKISVSKRKNCPVCGGIYSHLSGKNSANPVRMCGSSMFQIRGRMSKSGFLQLKKSLSEIGKVTDFGTCFRFRNMTLFDDGRALVKARDEKEARILYSRFLGG
jgi:molybdopterin/thiamine biosynthesis adenylyltransferase